MTAERYRKIPIEIKLYLATILAVASNSSVIRQKGKSENGDLCLSENGDLCVSCYLRFEIRPFALLTRNLSAFLQTRTTSQIIPKSSPQIKGK